MSKYTTEVRFICESYSGLDESKGYNSVNEIVAQAREKVFDFEYPIYDESYRSVLETKILKHFYTREIGAETVGQWKLWLDTRMNEIMPYYNQRYKSTLIEFNPIIDTNITTDHSTNVMGVRDDNGTSANETSGHGKVKAEQSDVAWQLYSDTPQGDLNGIESVDNKTYLTNATKNTDEKDGTTETWSEGNGTGTTTNHGTFNNTEDYIEHITGKRSGVSYSKLLEEFRNTFLNIDLEIIHELDDLFFNLW